MKEESNYTKSGYIDITKNRTFREWGISLVLLISLTSYIAIFWARLAKLLPPPYNQWTFIYEPLIGPWWINNFFLDQPEYIRLEILWYILCFVSSLVIPIIFLVLIRRKLTDFGLGMLNKLGIRLTGIAIMVSIPFGLWIQITVNILATQPYRIHAPKVSQNDLAGLWDSRQETTIG